ncbi:uncharacterized protein LOC123542437 [Mercenaria mercenaria]|uniref:uncharacterized protein LOC123542437 n=1 Tax=Mercenaria mercenaria TaxID=6596 RepID=UPI00234E50BA|nr:uncharacterized protein LOC123542437 [Mercenaria mercenaria]
MDNSESDNGEFDDTDTHVDKDAEKIRNETSTYDFTEKSWRTDFVLVVEETRLYVSKAILSLVSPVFDTMFQSNFKESTCDELELPGKKLDDVVEFLRCIYPNTCTKITSDNAENLLPLIEEYQVLQLKTKCEDALLKNDIDECTVEELFQYLRLSSLYDLKELREKCIFLAADVSEAELDEASEKFPLPPEVMKEIFEVINKRLRDDVTYYSDSYHDECNTSDRLKRKNEELEQDQAILQQYLSAEIRRKKEIKLDSDYNWQGKHVVLEVDMESDSRPKTEVTIWDIPFTVQAYIDTDYRSGEDRLKIDLKNMGSKIVCAVRVRIILVNRQPKGQNITLSFEGNFSSSPVFKQRMIMFTKSKDQIMSDENGLVLNGKIGLIVQIYLTQPNII